MAWIFSAEAGCGRSADPVQLPLNITQEHSIHDEGDWPAAGNSDPPFSLSKADSASSGICIRFSGCKIYADKHTCDPHITSRRSLVSFPLRGTPILGNQRAGKGIHHTAVVAFAACHQSA